MMETNIMKIKKKIYNTPELIEYGNLAKITQDGCVDGTGDSLEYDFEFHTSTICG